MTRRVAGLVVIALLAGCGKNSDNSPLPPRANVVAVSIGNSSVCNIVNQVCAAVTVCQPATSNCQVVADLLVDTGSFGIRIFRSAIPSSIPLTQITDAQGQIGECAFFFDGTAFWGAVQVADIRLGGEPAVTVPIQVIDASFAGQNASSNPCQTAVETSPAGARFKGILGIGLLQYDCGLSCVNSPSNLYFSCSGSTCNATSVGLAQQVKNPIPLLPVDNNGMVMQLPAVPDTGAGSATGALILGIGTASNNTPASSVTMFKADNNGNFTTTFEGASDGQSFIDSGSNALFFPSTTLPVCSGSLQSFYCPTSTASLSATVMGNNGTQGVVGFQIANTKNLVSTGNSTFGNLGGGGSNFDWGLPFFLGRTVYIGIENQNSSLGVGPYWAF